MPFTQIARLLIVDDDAQAAAFWKVALEDRGFRVSYAENLDQMRNFVKTYSFDFILLDLQLGDENGLDGISTLLTEAPYAQVFVLTANSSIQTAVEAMKRGAAGYITKDTPPEKITIELTNHLNQRKKEETSPPSDIDLSQFGLFGESRAYSELCQQIKQFKDVDSTVLILGESGTGKEVVARALHQMSNRSQGRFEAINCAAVPENLLESELFGHKRGAFTDAKTDRKGIFEICTNGTLLLDEIGDMPLSLQAKLLRVLQERIIVPLGSSQSIKINTRVIAATHRDLREEIENGRFREDLYYRLSVLPLFVPPLRHRKGDIDVLVQRFIKEFNERFGKSVAFPSHDVLSRIKAYDWPGNIRELRNSIERAVVLTNSDKIDLHHVFQHIDYSRTSSHQTTNNPSSSTYDVSHDIDESLLDLPLTEAKQIFEKTYITHLLAKTSGNVTEASKIAGRYRADIYRLIDKFGLDHQEYR